MNDLGKNEENKQLNQDDLPETSDNSEPDEEVMPEVVIKPEAASKIDADDLYDFGINIGLGFQLKEVDIYLSKGLKKKIKFKSYNA